MGGDIRILSNYVPEGQSADQIVHALDTPSVDHSGDMSYAPSVSDYHSALDPAQKGDYSVNGPPMGNLTIVSPNYGYRAGATSVETLVSGSDPMAAPAVPVKPSSILVYVALTALGYYAFKLLKKNGAKK